MKGAALDETAGKLLVIGLAAVLLALGLVGSLLAPVSDTLRTHRSGERLGDRTPSAPGEREARARPEERAASPRGEQPAARRVDDRLEKVRAYIEGVNAGEYRKAYALLASQMPYDAFVAGVEASNRSFAETLKKTDAVLVSKKIESVEPVTVEPDYVIVSVVTRVAARRAGELYVQDMNSQIYFRFDERGRIALLYRIGA